MTSLGGDFSTSDRTQPITTIAATPSASIEGNYFRSYPSRKTAAWGDTMRQKLPNTLRVVIQTISGFPVHHRHVKNRQIISFINANNVDICAMSEMNVCWHLLPIHERLHERTLGWWETLHISHGYNRNSRVGVAYQKGGVAIFSINNAAHRVIQTGHDPSGLGRWSWTRYRGRNGVILRVISAYRPVLNQSGALGVYNQHKFYMDNNNDDRCPRQAMLEDLSANIKPWMVIR